MPVDLSQKLVIGITSTALFDLSETDKKFREAEAKNQAEAIAKYKEEVISSEDIPLSPGAGFPLIKSLLSLNDKVDKDEPIVEVIVTSKNSPETGLRILNSIKHHKLNITRSIFRAGQPIWPFMKSLYIDLFLTTDTSDAQNVIDSGDCAAAIISGVHNYPEDEDFIKIAFDGDAVLFSEESEIIYKLQGMEAFRKHETINTNTPMNEGPYAKLLKKIAFIRNKLPMRMEYSPLRISIVTARNSPADIRVIKTLRNWGVYVDEAYFLGGLDKGPILDALKPHIFFDDQQTHLNSAIRFVPAGRVPYSSKSPLFTKPNTQGDEP